jgi:hypothetical protein
MHHTASSVSYRVSIIACQVLKLDASRFKLCLSFTEIINKLSLESLDSSWYIEARQVADLRSCHSLA